MQLGIIAQPLQLLFTVTGVTIALVHVTLPVVVVMLAAAIAHIDPDYEKAAESLGAGPLRIFFTVTLPLSGPGIVAGLTTAFAWTFSAFATPQLSGGGQGQHGLESRLSARIRKFQFSVRGGVMRGRHCR